jgi:translation initiation factor eIF-2B subunit beta
MAAVLAATGIDTTLIPDAAVYAVMSRVNKVIMGTHTVLSNGGLIAAAGGRAFALAARAHGVPLVVLCPVYKLCPLLPHDLEREFFGVMSNPGRMFSFATRAPVVPCGFVATVLTAGGGHSGRGGEGGGAGADL